LGIEEVSFIPPSYSIIIKEGSGWPDRTYPANIRVVKPDRIEIRLAIDDIRNKNEHGFVRSGRCDKTRQLRRLPSIPKIKINIEK
jgi:hypothetical protein